MNKVAIRWALDRAVGYTIGTAIVAVLLAALLSDTDAERFATVVYIAGIFAALLLSTRAFFPAAECVEPAPKELPLPASLKFIFVVAILLMPAAAFVAQPRAELLLGVAFIGVIGVMALARAGTLRPLTAAFGRGGRLAAAARYGVVAATAGLALAALLPSDAEGLVKIAYLAAAVATLAVGISLAVRTPAGREFSENLAQAAPGRVLSENVAEAVRLLKTPAGAARTFASAPNYATVTAVAALLLSAVLPEPSAERFATTAYVAALLAAITLGIKWYFRAFAADAPWGMQGIDRVWFWAVVALLTSVGAALAPYPIAEYVAMLVWIATVVTLAARSVSETRSSGSA